MINPEYDILNAIDDGVLIINRDYKILFANQAFFNSQKVLSEDLIGENYYALLNHQSVPCPGQSLLEKAFQKGTPVIREHHHLLADGSKELYQIHTTPLKNEQGEVTRILQLFKNITEQETFRTALANSHMELERVFNSAPFTISYLDRQMRVIRLNPAMEKSINRNTEELKGQCCYDIWGQYCTDKNRKGKARICDSCNAHHALEDGQRYVFERWIGDRFFEVASVPVLDKDNTIIGVLEIGNDITARKQAQDALSLERNNFRNILNTMEDGVYIVNEQYEIEYLNTALKEQFGEVKGEKCYSYFHDLSEVCPWCKNKEVLQGKTVHWEWSSPQTGRIYDLVDTPLKNGDGTVSKLEIFRDVTERKNAELALLKSKEEWERTFNSIPDIVILQDRDLCIVKINQAGCDTFSLSSDDLKNKHCYELFSCTLKESCTLCPLRETKNSLQPFSREIFHENLKKTFLITVAPMLDEQGQFEYAIIIARDITEQKKQQRESDQHLQQIIQTDKLASLGEVVAGVAHEINNPNSFISYNIPLLEEIWQVLQQLIDREKVVAQEAGHLGMTVDELCQDMSDIIEAIKVGSDRINKVVNNLKDFARLDESSNTELVQLNEIVEKTYSIVGAQVRKTVNNIEFHLGEDLPAVKGHFQKLEQVVANILMNASHALQERPKGKISIATRSVKRLNSVLVTIEDNGVGMKAEVLTKLFEPFFTTRRNSGGTGLGLSVSYGLIQEHAGCIGVLSRAGMGTCFSLFLPLDPLNDPVNLHPAILLVDEEKELSTLTDILEEGTESEIFTLSEQETIIHFLLEHPEVDIILAPMKSHRVNGRQLLEEVKKQFPLVAVFLYGEGDVETSVESTLVEPDRLLQKPFLASQLLDAINSINRICL